MKDIGHPDELDGIAEDVAVAVAAPAATLLSPQERHHGLLMGFLEARLAREQLRILLSRCLLPRPKALPGSLDVTADEEATPTD